ncbi:MAG: hypothetical protein H0U27_00975 [Nitrosopumilus sp.]|nr:hypothetical protein [Nitrosopumilus sp.]
MQTSIGLILLFAPFLNIFFFKDRIKGFLYVFIFVSLFHTALALLTQTLHVFTYPVVITFTIIGLGINLFFVYKYRKTKKVIFPHSVNWFFVCALIIVFFELWSVRFFYTGPVSTGIGIVEVERSGYTYPQFSDEWIGVALCDYVIESHSLPTVNPLNNNQYFSNPLIVFFSVLSELFLLLHLTPLIHYSYIAIASGMLLILSIYIVCRSYRIHSFAATLVILSVPYIVNGANIPGIWYLLPYSVGSIFFFIMLSALKRGEFRIGYCAALLSLIFYPPMVVFVLPTLSVDIFLKRHQNNFKRYALYSALVAITSLAIVTATMATKGPLLTIITKIPSYIVRSNGSDGIPSHAFWNVLPLFVLPFLCIGLFHAFRKKEFLYLVLVSIGSLLWIVYAFTTQVFIIEYPRVVIITSLLCCISIGWGIEYAYKLFSYKNSLRTVHIGCIILFAMLAGFYPRFNQWQDMILSTKTSSGPHITKPASPINRYLTSHDLMLFESIHEKRFISPPWKGLVIGVATHNYPLDSKPSTITNSILLYDMFISESCKQKVAYARRYKIDYVYSSKFDCNGFDYRGSSSEGLQLYEYKR